MNGLRRLLLYGCCTCLLLLGCGPGQQRPNDPIPCDISHLADPEMLASKLNAAKAATQTLDRQPKLHQLQAYLQTTTCLRGDSVASAWKWIGDQARDGQDLASAIEAYGAGLRALRQTHFEWDSSSHALGGELMHASASQYAKLGAQDSAKYYAIRAILAKSWRYGIDAPEVAKSYTILAQACQNDKMHAAAVGFRKKVLEIRQRAANITPREMAIAWFNLGDGQIDAHAYSDSEIALDSAQAYLPKLARTDSLLILYNLLQARARLAEAQHLLPAAQQAIADWLALEAAMGGAAPTDKADLHITAGNIARRLKDWGGAIAHYHTALQLYAPGNETLTPLDIPTLEQLGHDPNVFAAMALKARALAFHPDSAVAQYWVLMEDRAFQYWDGLRRGFWQWEVKADRSTQAVSEFEFALHTAIARGLENKAFEWLERSKENELLDIVQDLHRLNLAPIPIDTIRLARTFQALIPKQPQYQDSLDLLLKAVRMAHPGQLQPQPTFVTIQDVQHKLSGDSTMLVSYFWGPQYLIAAAVTESAETLMVLPLASGIARDLAAFRRNLQDDNTDSAPFATAANKVYSALLAPLFQSLTKGNIPPRLLISPHGALSNIPFEALTTAPATIVQDFRDLPYLLRATNISYVHSATLWLAYRDTTAIKGGVLGIGSSGGFRNTGKIENVVSEVQSIVDQLGGLAMIDETDAEHAIKSRNAPYAILHAAAHGEFMPHAPLRSRLLFPDDPISGEDGDLHAYEVMELHLPHQMAVLSACETGPGGTLQGNEVMSMGYAFQVARCSTVVMSLWDVHDHSTSTIMEGFYAQIAKGEPVAQAFTKARRDFLLSTKAQFTHPYYWAPWLLAGNGELRFATIQRPPNNNAAWRWWQVAAAGGLVVLSWGLWKWRRQKRFRWQ